MHTVSSFTVPMPATLAVLLVFRATVVIGSRCHHSADVDNSTGEAAACRHLEYDAQDADVSVLLQTPIAERTLLRLGELKGLGDDDDDNHRPMAKWFPWLNYTQPAHSSNTPDRIDELRSQLKLKQNTAGDIKTFMSALIFNSVCVAMFVLTFCFLARWYPVVYSDNANKGIIHEVPAGFFGWVSASLGLSFEEIEKTAGLDAAMFVEFMHLAIRLCLLIAIPKCLILCPLHLKYGDTSSFHDKLSRIGIGNLPDGSWVFWVHVGMLWYVVILTRLMIFHAQDNFVKRRFAWIAKMPYPRATTVLVEGIPREYCTDEALKAFFCKLFSEDQVVDAYVIKNTDKLQKQVEAYNSADQSVAAAQFEWEQAGGGEDQRPKFRDYRAQLVDKLDYYTNIRRETALRVEESRQNIMRRKDVVYTSTGFVTFRRRREAAVALYLKVDTDDETFQMSTPPDPSDVIYADFLYVGPWLAVKEFLGYVVCVGLFFAFTPVILAISSLINLDRLLQAWPALHEVMIKFPCLERTLAGVLASAALTLVMSFLPSIFIWIFTTFFQLKAGQWAQARLQQWYFYFQVCFILLVPAVGASLVDTLVTILEQPMSIFVMLAYRLPSSTHFYMNYITMQWMVHGMNLTRYMNFIKFKAFSAVFDEQRAKELSEPEDQDYYGMGGRSARFSLVLSVALVYCSLAPLIAVLTAINFLLCRVIYGYLLVFAETPKPDLGGVFWVAQLKHIQLILFIYVMLMIGVLSQRAETYGPAIVVCPALFFVYKTMTRFHTAYDWEFLSFRELVDYETEKEIQANTTIANLSIRHSTSRADLGLSRDSYAQPELTVPSVQEITLSNSS